MIKMEKLINEMSKQNLDAVLITKPENRYYFSNFTGSSGYVVITNDRKLFITDFRYKEQASMQCESYEIVLHYPDYKLSDIINELKIETLGFEDEYMTFNNVKTLEEELFNIKMVPLKSTIETIRQVKSEDEINKIAKAASIADTAFTHIKDFIKIGMTEKEVALELEFFMKKQGASKLSFDSIIASGWRSALPHGVASDKVIENGDFVTMDFGCVFEGYCSDMTRTVVMGKASDKQKKIYNLVLLAQETALGFIKEGLTGVEVDKVARDIIEEAGYGDYFGHGLGHGLGLEVHENPRLSPQGTLKLVENNIVTDEPGIYIPDFGGVRIEDLICVKKDGCVRLSNSSKELIEL